MPAVSESYQNYQNGSVVNKSTYLLPGLDQTFDNNAFLHKNFVINKKNNNLSLFITLSAFLVKFSARENFVSNILLTCEKFKLDPWNRIS